MKRDVQGNSGRRRALGALAAGATLLVVRSSAVLAEELAAALREAFGERSIRPGRVRVEVPRLVENGNVVPVRVGVDSPMTPQEHVTGISLFAEKNRVVRVLDMKLGPHNGRAVAASRIRVATSQQVTAVAELNDGSLWSAAVDVEVVTSDCGL
ncbi:MAG TPA: thiosulfate oxidation carrier protein SoxY [Burkholderiales bacterium]|nr:thiosulfate oxidation carrier protein SoxY [Burkholderiales bacterium]